MSADLTRRFLTLDASKVTGVQMRDIVTAVVAAVPDVEMLVDSYHGLVFSHPELVVPADWNHEVST